MKKTTISMLKKQLQVIALLALASNPVSAHSVDASQRARFSAVPSPILLQEYKPKTVRAINHQFELEGFAGHRCPHLFENDELTPGYNVSLGPFGNAIGRIQFPLWECTVALSAVAQLDFPIYSKGYADDFLAPQSYNEDVSPWKQPAVLGLNAVHLGLRYVVMPFRIGGRVAARFPYSLGSNSVRWNELKDQTECWVILDGQTQTSAFFSCPLSITSHLHLRVKSPSSSVKKEDDTRVYEKFATKSFQTSESVENANNAVTEKNNFTSFSSAARAKGIQDWDNTINNNKLSVFKDDGIALTFELSARTNGWFGVTYTYTRLDWVKKENLTSLASGIDLKYFAEVQSYDVGRTFNPVQRWLLSSSIEFQAHFIPELHGFLSLAGRDRSIAIGLRLTAQNSVPALPWVRRSSLKYQLQPSIRRLDVVRLRRSLHCIELKKPEPSKPSTAKTNTATGMSSN